jgi:hypothetical protein
MPETIAALMALMSTVTPLLQYSHYSKLAKFGQPAKVIL